MTLTMVSLLVKIKSLFLGEKRFIMPATLREEAFGMCRALLGISSK